MTQIKAVAIVGLGAVMPDANTAPAFWEHIKSKRYLIKDVPADRWSAEMYYHADPSVPDKTYSKIGSWVHNYPFEPLKWGILIPPSVLGNMDDSQKWSISASREALLDYGYPERPLDPERVAVIFGNSLAGEKHYRTNLRIHIPQFTKALGDLDSFQNLPPEVQQALLQGMEETIRSNTPEINEDTMPGELANIIAGRVANVFNFSGANFVTDAACASSLAAMQAAMDGLLSHQYDAVLTGGVDRNNGAASFVKFAKIGALSPDGSRPYAEGANGFVMGEGAAVFLLKRLEDAERDQDKIYAVIRGIGSSSDGKGKGITAPNPSGQQRAIERAWKDAGVDPASVGLIEGHGTSTKVGDVVEVNSLASVFGKVGLAPRTVGLGSVKSNVGHLKSASGAAGLLKLVYALHEKVLPPSANFHKPNPDIPFDQMPFFVVTETQPWEKPAAEIRRAGLSSFGFGGTNFHMVVEEYLPGLLTSDSKLYSVPAMQEAEPAPQPEPVMAQAVEAPAEAVPELFGNLLFLSASTTAELVSQLRQTAGQVSDGQVPPNVIPSAEQLRKPVRLAISFDDNTQLGERIERAFKALDSLPETNWQAYSAHGIYYGEGAPGKVAFLFPGQGSQYVNMMRDIAEVEPLVAETFRDADEVMTPHLGQPLTSYIFQDSEDEEVLKAAAKKLSDTTITQPAILTANIAMLRLMQKFNIEPDMLIGHSLGEYAALVAAEAITFKEGLEVVSARGRAMASLAVEDNGTMAAVSAPIEKVEEILATIDGYVILANINSPVQCVIGGATAAVDKAVAVFEEAGIRAVKIPVSHAFHTKIVAPASDILRTMLEKIDLKPPKLPISANVTGELYPNTRAEMLELLSAHIASSVQFVKGVQTLYDNGCRVYIEAGPKRVLSSLARDILKEYPDVTAVATNHGRKGGVASFHEALCSLYAAGLGAPQDAPQTSSVSTSASNGHAQQPAAPVSNPARQTDNPYPALTGSVVISGAGLGLPGRDRDVFNDDNIHQILKGEIRIEPLPDAARQEMVDRKITRLEKGKNGAEMVSIDSLDQTLKLAGQRGKFDLARDFGVKSERVSALDITTQLAIAAGIEALRDAGIPLVMRYKPTSTGGFLPQRWMLPPSLSDETGVIFASAFPGLDQLSHEAAEYHQHKTLSDQIALLRDLIVELGESDPAQTAVLRSRLEVLEAERQALDYGFDRKFIFRILNMGHAQFAEYIGARGPNTGVNAACATTTHAVAIAEDWIRAGRARRVVVIAGDDVTGGDLVSWVGTGLLATGATTTEGDLRMAALPFDKRRNGMIPGMGAAALVIESQDAVAERGMGAIAEVLATDIANSAFHGTRLDVDHVSEVMQRLMDKAERQFGLDRHAIAAQTMFMSHETYTPARGGSAAAEIRALRDTFEGSADQVMVTNTKGYTGHTMGVGIEDVVAVKGLEHSMVPPIANLDEKFEPDPELGNLNLSRKPGTKDVHYALRLGAGFGSQIAMALLRRIPGVEQRVNQPAYQKWLAEAAGYESAELEVVQRTLRIKDQGVPAHEAKPSTWVYGTGPRQWAPAPGQPQPSAPPEVQPDVQPVPVAQPAPVSSAVAEATAPAVAAADEETIKTFVLNLVSEKTGYPTDILDLGLDLEADLGIDTVKQAELFASVRENFGIPRREDLMLADYNTLEKVIGFVKDNMGQTVDASPAPQPEPAAAVLSAASTTFAAPAAQAADDQAIKTFVLNLVSEKTGYPTDILDLGLDLEADLGIDTVKQAELFASVRENFGIPRREDLMLADYNTLEKVIGFVKDNMGQTVDASPAPASQPEPAAAVPSAASTTFAAPAAQAADDQAIKTFVLNLVSEKTGYPTDILDLGLDLEADLGIDTVKQAELFASVRENYGIPRREDLMLADYNTLEKVIGFVKDNMGTELVESPAAPVAEPTTPAQTTTGSAVTATKAPVSDSADEETIKTFVLNLVSEKTGYPTDILDLGLDLEADLGIDTVKQAELFASVRENYGIPRREDLMLADYNTLEKVIGFVKENMNGGQAEETLPEPAAKPVAAAAAQPEPAVEVEPKPVPAAQTALSAAPGEDDEAIKTFVLNLVSEKTGYPTDILDLGLDLEADLGIDTVKQAELFASVRENYNIPRREDLMLADYNTLEKVIGFVKDNMGQSAEEAVEAPAEATPAKPASGQSIPRRVPVPMLRPRLDLCRPTGVSLEKGSRVIVVSGRSKVGTALVKALEERKVEVLRVKASDDLAAQAEAWLEQGPVAGVYYLPGLDSEPDLEAITTDEWGELIQSRLEPLYALMKAVPEDLFLVSATRAGGLHGYDENGALMTGAGVSGFTKALAMERRDALVKVIDFAARDTSAEISAILIAETERDPAAAEVGYREGQRYSLALVENDFSAEQTLELPEKPVFLVSGGTGGITLRILTDLAERTRGRFYLIGRTSLPSADHPDLTLLRTSKEDLQSKWMQESEAAGEKLTPVQIRGRVEALERIVATIETIETIRQLGGEVTYLTGDITDGKSVTKLVKQTAQDAGRIDVLIHAAGYERSRKLRNKPLDEFQGIVDVKATGFIHLYKAMQAAKALPRAMVLFSSIAGRYGNTGQTDYSAANDLLGKFASILPHRHPGIRVTTLDWGAWGEVGMASRGNTPWLMEQAGIEMIDPSVGAPLVYQELFHGSGNEVLFSGSLGALEETSAETLDLEAANQALRAGEPIHVMLSSVSGYSPQDGVTFEVTLDPNSEPFLHDHAMNGTPLLPGVMGIEGFAVAAQHIASVLGSGEKSDLQVSALEDIQFLTPFKFYRNEPRHILWKAMPLRRNGHLIVSITLESRSPSKLAADSDELIQHFSGTVHLQPENKAVPAAVIEAPDWNGHYTLKDETIYELYFHGPAFQVLEGVQRSGDHLLGKLRKGLPEFTSRPTRLDTTPLLLELCLQTAGIWEIGLTGALALPHSIGKVKLYHRPVNGEPIYAQVHMDESGDGIVFRSQVVDGAGNVYLEMENYRTSATPYPVDESQRAPLQKLIAGD